MKCWFLLLPLALLLSCAVQKRKYQKGFYFSGKHVAKNTKKDRTTTTSFNNKKIISEPASEVPVQELSASAVQGTDPAVIAFTHKKVLIQNTDTCDQIIFRDGKEVMAKIIEISPTEIRYKKCGMEEGPFFVSRKSDLFMIRFANGTKEVFELPVTQASPRAPVTYPTIARYADPQKVRSDAVMALVFGITGLLLYFGSIPAIVLGRRVLKEVKQNPHKYPESDIQTMARTGLVLGIVKWSIVVLVILISLMAFMV